MSPLAAIHPRVRRVAGALAVAAVAVLPALGQVLPVGASTLTGVGAFNGSATLSEYPCNATCSAQFTGTFVGSLAGLEVGTAVYQVTFPDPTSGAGGLLSGNLSTPELLYDEVCPLGLTTPALGGTAGGVFTVAGGALVDTNNHVAAHGISFTGSWSWSRVAAGAELLIFLEQVTDSSGTVLASNTVLGAGAAAAYPLSGNPLATCAAPSTVTMGVTGVIGNPA